SGGEEREDHILGIDLDLGQCRRSLLGPFQQGGFITEGGFQTDEPHLRQCRGQLVGPVGQVRAEHDQFAPGVGEHGDVLGRRQAGVEGNPVDPGLHAAAVQGNAQQAVVHQQTDTAPVPASELGQRMGETVAQLVDLGKGQFLVAESDGAAVRVLTGTADDQLAGGGAGAHAWSPSEWRTPCLPKPALNRAAPAAPAGSTIGTRAPRSARSASSKGRSRAAYVDARSVSRHSNGKFAISAANSCAACTARPGSVIRFARPMAWASSASTGRPVKIMSRARPRPTPRGNRTVPPSISGTPHLRQNTPITASDSITRRSARRASSRPPATAWPLIAAINGLLNRIRVGPIGPLPPPSGSSSLRRWGSPTAVRSAPARKVRPVPARIAMRCSGSVSKSSNAARSSAAMAPSTALRRSGRSI